MPHLIRLVHLLFTQPDGTGLELRGSGDEFYAVFETLDGYTVLFDRELKAYCYARPGSNGGLVSSGVQVHRGNPAALGLASHLREDVAVPREQVRQRYRRWNAATHIEQRWKQRKTALQRYEAQPGSGSGVRSVDTLLGLGTTATAASCPALQPRPWCTLTLPQGCIHQA